ncbi:MAG TPA: response regulator transcription factor [Actinomycetota bacterium]
MIRIYIITEVRSYGEALGQALHGAGRVEVVGSSGHPMEALEDLVAMDVDVVLLDVPWPEGPLWAAEIRAVAPEVLVVVLGLAEAEHRMITWAQAGVAGYLGREASLEEFGEAIEGATRREPSFLPETATIRLRRIAAAADALSPACGQRSLTTREREILQLVGQGLSNQQIARRLYIALPTVKNHVHNILEKLGVHRRIDAVAEVRRGGFGFGAGPAPTDGTRPYLHAIRS